MLIGNDEMDRLWRIESDYDQDPGGVNPTDVRLYQDTMVDMVRKVLLEETEGLFESELIDYEEFLSHLNRLKEEHPPLRR